MNIYQILPRLYGTGKFSEFDSRFFDYVKSLSMSHVWFTGIPRHTTGHPYVKGDPGSPYSICDYYDVNPYFAEDPSRRMEEFQALLDRTHAAGLKVITDFVPNHIAPDYSDSKGGIPHFDYCDYDWTDTVKINYSAPGCWEKMLDIVLYWAGKGVDGFRCDMVEMVPPEFFQWLIAEVKKAYPSVIFIAEVYTRERYWQYINQVGFDYLYDKSGLYDILKDVVNGASASRITSNWQGLGEMQMHVLNFLENHDEQRFASPYFGASANSVFAPLALSSSLTSAPFMLYFGQELGADASETDNGRTSIFCWSKPVHIQQLHSYITTGKGLTSAQRSLLSRYREMLRRAAKSSDAHEGFWDLCYCNIQTPGFDVNRHFAWARIPASCFEAASGTEAASRRSRAKAGITLYVSNFGSEPASFELFIPAEFPSTSLAGSHIAVEVGANDCTCIAL